jgi:hypothetical protein
MKGTRRNLGDLISPKPHGGLGRDGKPRRRSRRGRGEESDGCIITCEASNKADRKSVAEMVEGRRPAGGKASSNARPGHSAGCGV